MTPPGGVAWKHSLYTFDLAAKNPSRSFLELWITHFVHHQIRQISIWLMRHIAELKPTICSPPCVLPRISQHQ